MSGLFWEMTSYCGFYKIGVPFHNMLNMLARVELVDHIVLFARKCVSFKL